MTRLAPLTLILLLCTCNLERVEDPSGNCANPPVADFSITNAGCFAPCDVVFTNASTNATSFEWDFGDGTPKVTQINPTHKYALPGDYLVTLTATSPGCTNSIIKTVQVNTLTFTKTFGGANDDWGYSVQQTADGGYILLGSTRSEGAGDMDMYLIKTDNAGNLIWKKTFGGTGYDVGYSVQQTIDGGYILLGETRSEGAGETDMYLVKTDNNGNLTWKKTFGGANSDEGYSVQQTADGGYILLGTTLSEGVAGDMYLVKTDNVGNIIWKRTFGGANSDEGYSVQQTADGGYILLGSIGGAGSTDMYLVKTDNIGNLTWERTFGGGLAIGQSVQQTADGGYILLGATRSEGAGEMDMYLVKTDNAGTITWKRTFGGTENEWGYSVQQTNDGGYILLGSTSSEGAVSGDWDMYLVKIDNVGALTWKRTFGGALTDWGFSVQQTADGGYILLGNTDLSILVKPGDFYLVKTDKDGNL